MVVASNISKDKYLNEMTGSSHEKLFNQKPDLSIDTKSRQDDRILGQIVTSESKGTFISGSGDNFTIFFEDEEEMADGKLVSIISGSIKRNGTGDITGIKDYQTMFVMKDDFGDPNNNLISIGKGRKSIAVGIAKIWTGENPFD